MPIGNACMSQHIKRTGHRYYGRECDHFGQWMSRFESLATPNRIGASGLLHCD
jgi:hypothetical protein